MQAMTFDEALIKRVGQFGRGQLILLTSASLCLIANAAAFFFLVFAAVNPITQHQWRCVDPADSACQAVKQQQVPSIPDFCALPQHATEWTSFDSIIAQFSLVCSDAWKVQFTNSLMFMGALLGSGVFGFACDRWGRKKPLYVATALIAVSMYSSLAASNYWVLAAMRIVTGFGAAGQSHCNFLLSTEGVGPAYRGLAGILALSLFIVGEFVMVALGFALPNWRHLLLACASINAATLLLYPFVRESGRWLLSKGRTEEAKQFLQYLATTNKSQMPSEPLVSSHSKQQLVPDLESQEFPGGCGAADSTSSSAASSTGSSVAGDAAAAEQAVTVMQLVRHPRMAVRLLILLITSFSIMLSYYGISLGAGGIPGSIYMTFAIGSAAEAVAVALVAPTVDRVGRHNIVAVGQLLGGAACIACGLVKGGSTQAALAAIGKFGCAAASSVCNTYVAELLPTSCRSSVLGITTQASRVGSIAAPFLLMMGAQVAVGNFSQVFIPFMVFGCLAVLSGLLIMLMPETLGAAMPENVEDLENLLSVFAAKPWRKGCGALVAFMFRTRARAASPFSATGTAAGSTGSSIISQESGGSESGGLDAVRVCVIAGNKLAPSKDADSDTQQTGHNNS